ncbi:MAG: YbhN family protein [Nocardiaceae bacterium]|nr:YbhN family protein [Nocardiaceae bacterium]
MDADQQTPSGRRSHGRFRWLRWVGGIALLALLTAEGIYLWPRLHESWHALYEIHIGWLAASILAQLISMSGFARVQKQLLSAGGVDVRQAKSLSLVYGATAMSVTLPAGQVFATALTYRETRRWGASPIVASWQLAFSGVIAAVGLAVVGVTGAMLAGTRVSSAGLIISVAILIVISVGVRYAASHPGSLDRLVAGVVKRLNRLRKRPAEEGLDRVQDQISQIESVKMRPQDSFLILLWTTMHRVGDVACLGFACLAIGADPTISGLLLTFAFGKAVGTIPLAPGGLVIVDATLILSLTSTASLTATQSVAAAFVYRGVSFIMIAILGWIVFAFRFRTKGAKSHLGIDVDQQRRKE